MGDRLKLAALLSVALIALATLGLIVYNFVANDWRLDTDPLDMSAIFGSDETEIHADERATAASYHYGDSINAVRVETQALRVEVRRSSSRSIDVHMHLIGDASDTTRYRTALAVGTDGTLTVTGASSGPPGNASGVVRIILPPGPTLQIDANDGDVALEGSVGPIDIATTSGSITASGIRGVLRCRSLTGDVALDACSADSIVVETGGRVRLSLTEGSVRARAARITSTGHFGSFAASALENISLDMLSTSARVHLVCEQGGVRLRVLEGARFSFDAATTAGTIVADVPFDSLGSGDATPSRLRATINGGGIPAFIRAHEGDIEILLFKAGESPTIEQDV